MNYKVLITTSGIGSRLGELTKYTNKSLVRVGKKPAISYIIEAYPKDTKFVVTIGYFGDQVKDFLTLAYPDRQFEFVVVDKYEGPGTSLGYSMLQAKDVLQCPFIFHAGDTIVSGRPPAPTKNWMGVFKGEDATQYSSWRVLDGEKLVFAERGAKEFDYLHIGLVGIHDFQQYWSILEQLYVANPNDSTLNDCAVLVKMLEQGSVFGLVKFPTWYDIGNIPALKSARENIADAFHNLEKFEEDIFIFDDFVIKFFYNEKILQNRVKRAQMLSGLVPKLEGVTKNFYRYQFAEGDLHSRVANPVDFMSFLDWAKENLWRPTKEVSDKEFKQICYDFYKTKTEERVKKFLAANSIVDKEDVINGEKVPPVSELMKMIDFDWLSTTKQTQFHGDFILDNMIKTKDGYCLIDWRQDFGGLLQSGDIHYDLAKLNHNLTVSHDLVNENLFHIKQNDDGSVECDIHMRSRLADARAVLVGFLNREGIEKKRIGILTALIWLNMSPLHHYPFNIFLFYFGKYHLWRSLKPQ